MARPPTRRLAIFAAAVLLWLLGLFVQANAHVRQVALDTRLGASAFCGSAGPAGSAIADPDDCHCCGGHCPATCGGPGLATLPDAAGSVPRRPARSLRAAPTAPNHDSARAFLWPLGRGPPSLMA